MSEDTKTLHLSPSPDAWSVREPFVKLYWNRGDVQKKQSGNYTVHVEIKLYGYREDGNVGFNNLII